jgi:ATP-binding protein involved in chromosome partitioning
MARAHKPETVRDVIVCNSALGKGVSRRRRPQDHIVWATLLALRASTPHIHLEAESVLSLTIEQVTEVLRTVIDPNTGKDLVSTRSARNVRVDGGDVSVEVELGYPGKSQFDRSASS